MLARMLLASTIATSSMAAAQSSEQVPESGEEIIVTGERVARPIRETPSSVSVTTAEMLEASSADRLDQILEATPNVQVGSGEEGPAIRGQDSTGVLRNLFAFLGGTRPRVTVQIDGRPSTYYEYVNSSAGLWDVERVEVFRSPQTTTQGRNAIGGAIFVETLDPTYDWQGRARMLVGDQATRQGSLALSGPIVADQLAFRVSGDLRLGKTASDLADAIPGADVRRDDYGLARVKLLFEPKSIPDARLETTYVHTRAQSPQFEAVLPPYRERRAAIPQVTNGVHRIDVDAVTTRLDYEPAGAVLSTATFSFGDLVVQRFGLPGLGRTRVDGTDYSAEGILRWKASTGISLISGVNYIATRQRQSIDITGLGIGTGGFRDRQESLGLFGEATVRPVPPLSLTLGIRYQRDRQRRVGQVGAPPTGIALDYDGLFDAWLPKASLTYELAPRTTAGVLVQRAYNPGGTSISLFRLAEDSFQPETLWNYELFFRTSFAGGRGTLAANLFKNDIADAQRQQLVTIILPNGNPLDTPEFANAPVARSKGLEAELGYRAGRRLSLAAGIGLLRTRVVETVLPNDPTLGKVFQRAPRFSASGMVDWNPVDPLRLSVQLTHQSGYFSDDANTPALRIEPSTIVNLRGSLDAGPVTIFAYARNVFDTFYLTYIFPSRLGTAGDPRELGIGLEARF
ncbi:Colicin I receptor precursor [Tsuneonella dongtanensis]|uniref:Colicin I receptor n=1 Tax=Tsuneonella dongtanensis TaxID=692370 RepID=A0A1B2AFN0_9SPHN|nr:TonB-dependent receptor [Tsuneonella dongtanensis]ANY20950.1 Colicin I receptor precursor [Tsuneonella dongtanensis]